MIGLPFNLTGRHRLPGEPNPNEMGGPGKPLPGGPSIGSMPELSALVRRGLSAPDDMVRRAMQFQPPDEPDPDIPIIPNRRAGREFDIHDVANAGIVGKPRLTIKDRLRGAIQGMAAANTLDPNAENGVESFLGSALRSFSSVTGQAQEAEDVGDDLDAKITAAALQRRRQATEDYEAGTTRAVDRYARMAGAYRDIKAADAADDEAARVPDVEGISAALRAAGFSEVARYVEANRKAVEKNPSPFLSLLHSNDPDIPPEVTQAQSRVNAAEGFSASEIAQEQRSSDPDIAERLSSPEGIAKRREELTRLRNPNYAADSTLAATVRDYKRAPRVPGAAPRDTAKTKVDDAKEVREAAKMIDPATVPLMAAVRSLKAPDHLPWTPAQLHEILTLAGYATSDIEKALGKPRPAGSTRARF